LKFLIGNPHAKLHDLRHDESGQAIITVVLVTGTFLLGAVGLATDFSNLWFHKQKAQTAADAACQAGAMDLLEIAEGSSTSTSAGFTPGTGFTCSSTSGAAPCKYGALNGYSAPGLTPNTESNEIAVSFPGSVPGATAPPTGIGGANPFMRVDVTDRVKVIFSALFTGNRTQDVVATAKCGLVLTKSAPPIDVLSPTGSPSLSVQGTPTVAIIGGPSQSIQVNSNAAGAVNFGGNAKIDLSYAGPTGNGGILGITGGPYTDPGVKNFLPSATYYDPSSPPISDPFAQLATPSKPAAALPSTTAAYGVHGCPDSGGCDEYYPGDYAGQLQAKGSRTAIFNPGLYYLEGGLSLASNSTVRPTNATGNTDGTMFYFSGTSSVSVAANSGSVKKNGGIDSFQTNRIQCPGGAAVTLKDTSGNAVSQLDGNILMGSCSGTYGDPLGQNRGMLFFQDRSAAAAQPNWGGGGQFLLAGNMYFHHCNGSGTGTSCSSTAYDDVFTLQGNSGSGTFVLGDIIADNLTLGGTSGIAMNLNPALAYNILKVTLLQ
jgi:hypothetical protein